MTSLPQDIRFGIRMLLKNPGFTTIAVLTLALGIGANTAIFSVVNAVLLRPLPYPHPQQIVALNETLVADRTWVGSVSGPDFYDWQSQNHSFSSFAAYFSTGLNLSGTGDAQRIASQLVTEDYFKVFGVAPRLGRDFLPDEFKGGGNPVVILSDGLWHRVFGGDPGIIGKSITLSGQPYTVVGILPSSFVSPSQEDLWTPFQANNPMIAASRGSHWFQVYARLKEGATLLSANADMDAIGARLRKDYPDSNKTRAVLITSLQDQRVAFIRPALLVLQVAVGFVLLIACVNVANLLLAKSESRKKEMAVRGALGAGSARVVRQLMIENILLALVGAAGGLFLAGLGTSALLFRVPAALVRNIQVNVDLKVLGFTLLISIVSGLIFGLAPAIQAIRLDLNKVLRESGERSGTANKGSSFKNVLVVLEVSLAMLLLVGGGLLIRSFGALIQVSPGFEPHGLLTMQIYLPSITAAEVPKQLSSIREITNRIRSLAAVKYASTVIFPPFSGSNVDGSFSIEGLPAPKDDQQQYIEWRMINPQFFSAMGMPLLQGRDLTEQDEVSRAKFVVIDRKAVTDYFKEGNPVGKRISLWNDKEGNPVWLEIVGIAPEVHQFGLNQAPRPSAYFCISALGDANLANYMTLSPMSIAVRTSVSPATLSKPIVDAVHSVDPNIPVTGILPMDTLISQSLAQPQLASFFLGIFAALALLLAAIGIYGVLSYNVGQRTREIGIRLALGAQQSNVLGIVMKQGMSLGLIGLGIGLVASFGLTRFLKGLLFGVSATDPLTLVVVAFILALAVFAACYIPARRATRVDPIVALRYE